MRKISSIIIFFIFLTMVLVTLAGRVNAQTAISLDHFQALAREQGRDLKLLELSRSQAELGLAVIKGQFGLGSYYDSAKIKQDMESIESFIEERVLAIKLLKENIEQWESEKEDPDADTAELENQISQANQDLSVYQSELNDIRQAHANLVLRYYELKSREETVEPQLKPYEDALDQLTDAQVVQPRLMDYSVEQLYLSLLALGRQEEVLTKAMQLAQRGLEIEEVKLQLGLSTSLQVNAARENLLQSEEALQKVKAEMEECSRSLLLLAGLPFDFKFQPVPVNLDKEYRIADTGAIPDFTTSLAYRRAYNNLQDAREELEDTSIFDRKEYQLAEVNVEEAELQLQKTLEELEKNYLSRKEKFHLTVSAAENAALSLEQAQSRLETATLQHDLGMLSPLDLDQARLALMQAELACYSAQVQRQLAFKAYLLALEGIEIQPY